MSIYHFSSDVWTQRYHYPTTAMEAQHYSSKQTTSDQHFHHRHHRPSATFPVNLNSHDVDEEDQEELDDQSEDAQQLLFLNHLKEPMFEKPLTPSDVGKLNRLVIPKQHAERYFPLAGGSGGGGGGESPNDKGFLLSFEDELGKCWRFRYSYWNSSQSYVLTKGWSRYVKEKRLEAGDVVFFERQRTEGDRLFIGCRRRCLPSVSTVAVGGSVHDTTASSSTSAIILSQNSHTNYSTSSENRGWTRCIYSAHHPYPAHSHHHQNHYPMSYQADCLHAPGYRGQEGQTMGVGNSKILRLFGVNMECQVDEPVSSEPSTPIGSSLSSQGSVHPSHFYTHMNYSSNSPNHMDFTFYGDDVNQMRNG